MKQLDLFSGIGGFALAARWMGWETIQFVEKDEFCQKVLQKNFKGVPIHGDIKTFDGKPFRGTVDILTGGFPCQPYSRAGNREGTEDERHLWPEMRRVITEVRPGVIVGENVRGLIDWSGGLVFEEIQTSLEAIGYEVTSFILPACGKDAPHQRDRIWIIAHSGGGRIQEDQTGVIHHNHRNSEGEIRRKQEQSCKPFAIGSFRVTTNAHISRLPVRVSKRQHCIPCQATTLQGCKPARIHTEDYWREFPTQSPVCRGDDGIPDRVDRIKALGNAIVPQVAYEIFKAIATTL